MGQSRVSTHLALLKEVGLVVDRRAGRRTLYSIAARTRGGAVGAGRSRENRSSPEFEADLAGLRGAARRGGARSARLLRPRRGELRRAAPARPHVGGTRARASLQLAPRGRYADLGIGDGLLTLMLAEVADAVTAVDISPRDARAARRRARAAQGIANVETVEGEIEDLPLPDASHDVVVMSQALHHARDRRSARCSRRARILVPGGRLLVIDLLAHTEDWVREQLEHGTSASPRALLEQLLCASGLRAPCRPARGARSAAAALHDLGRRREPARSK